MAPPPSTAGFFPLKDVHAGLKATAWTVFEGTTPEPMEVEILGVMRGARGPGEDLILARLHGAKPEYTGVVAGMSGSPVYVGDKLLGSLSYRIGQFSKEPIAGITPIAQMLEVRDLPAAPAALAKVSAPGGDAMTIQAMETPLVMSGFRPEAVRLWQEKMAGTGMDVVSAGGGGSSLAADAGEISSSAMAAVKPGSAVSALLVRGDVEVAATCTVTYVDPKQLLACGHPLMQAGTVSLPMTTAEVLATLPSPLNAFKIVNTGATIGAFTEDRDAAIRGVLGLRAHMIPVHVAVRLGEKTRKLNFEVLDMPSLTPQAVMVTLYNTLIETNESSFDASYHVTGSISLADYPPTPVDVWAAGGSGVPPQMAAAILTGEIFAKIYANNARTSAVTSVDLDVETTPRNLQITLDSARIVTGDMVHPGDEVTIEATLRPWQQPARNVRIPIRIPAHLPPGNVRILVSDAATLDRTLDQPKLTARQQDLDTALALLRRQHAGNRIYVSLLAPVTQAEMDGHTMTGLPLSMANALETLRAGQDVMLNGESAIVAGDAPADGVFIGYQILNLHIDDGGGLH